MSYEKRRNRAARLSAEMVEPLNVTDIEDSLTERLDVDDLNRLFTAVEPKFAQYENRLELADMDEQAYLAIISARQSAYFNLGFCLAMKLVGRTQPPPTLKVVDKGEKCA